ncbi:MAG: hypothetical protein WC725_01355 [Patescibacteria group bacterium]|jgi:hypothetical protein
MKNGSDEFKRNMVPHLVYEGARHAFNEDQLPKEQVEKILADSQAFAHFVKRNIHELVLEFIHEQEEKSSLQQVG